MARTQEGGLQSFYNRLQNYNVFIYGIAGTFRFQDLWQKPGLFKAAKGSGAASERARGLQFGERSCSKEVVTPRSVPSLRALKPPGSVTIATARATQKGTGLQ